MNISAAPVRACRGPGRPRKRMTASARRSRAARWLPGFLALAALAGRAGAFTIALSADARQAPANGLAEITLTATVRDGGNLVRDGLQVRFTTTQGTLRDVGGSQPPGREVLVPVAGGLAKAIVQTTTFETLAQITATLFGVANSPTDQLDLVFGTRSPERQQTDNLIRVRGDYIWYGPETSIQIMDIIGNAQVSYRGVEVRANRIQLDLQEYLLLAKDLARGVIVAAEPPPYDEKALNDGRTPPYRGEALAMDLRTHTGSLYSAFLGETINFAGRALTRGPDRPIPAGMYDLFDLDDVKVWIEAKGALIYPHEKIRFDRAKFFVNGHKVFSLPYYFEALGYRAQFGPAVTQIVNYSSRDGFIVDFPYYFDVGDRHTNEFRLTRGVRTGLFDRANGFQISYAHHTDLKDDRGEFDFVIDGLSNRFGVQYHHQQRFGPLTFGTLSLAWPQHENFYSNATLYTPVGPGNLSLTMNLDYIDGFTAFDTGFSTNANLVWQANPVRLGSLGADLTPSLGLGYSRTLSGTDYHRQNVSLSLTRRPWRFFGGSGQLQSYMGLRFGNTVDGPQDVAYTFNTTWRQDLGPYQSWSFGYTFDTAWNSHYTIPTRHQLTANWQLYAAHRWTGYAYANYGLHDQALSLSALLDYEFLRNWGVAGQTLYQSSAIGSFSDSEIWFYRLLGTRELRLRYAVEEGKIGVEIDNNF